MTVICPISQADDPRIDDFRDLNQAERRRDHPGEDGIVIGEGALVIDRMLASYYPPRAFLGTEEGLHRLTQMEDYERLPQDTPFYLTTNQVISECVGFAFNRHIFAVGSRPDPRTVEDVLAATPRTIVLAEGLNDHANIGSLFRNAAALDVGGVLMGAGCADPLYRRSVRVSMGHVLRLPWASCFGSMTTWQEETFPQLRQAGYTIIALTPDAGAQDLAHCGEDGRGCSQWERVAFIVGAEGPGLRRKTLAHADYRARIPMSAGVDSLNVATSAAVAFYERLRDV